MKSVKRECKVRKELLESEMKIKSRSDVTSQASDENEELLALKSQLTTNYLAEYRKDSLNAQAVQAISQYVSEHDYISFEKFLKIRDMSSPKIKKYFSSKVFLYFIPNDEGIKTEHFLRYLQQSMKIERSVLQIMPHLALNDNLTTVSTDQWQRILRDEYLQLLDPNNEMDPSFDDFYLCTILQKFSIFLDPNNRNFFPLRALLHSEVFKEMQALISYQSGELDFNDYDKNKDNWFSVQNVLSVYTTFLQLDADHNGLLNIDEIKAFKGFGNEELLFTNIAWERLFEELVVFDPFELDYRGFVRLVLYLSEVMSISDKAMEKPFPQPFSKQKEIQGFHGLKFLWNVIDYDRSGRLSPMKIKVFYKEILQGMHHIHQIGSLPTSEEIAFEIYDILAFDAMSSVNDEGIVMGPTFEDILASTQAKLVLMMLLDVNCFWRYEFRESLMAQPTEDVEEEPSPPPPPAPVMNKTNNNKPTSSKASISKQFDLNSMLYDDEIDDYSFD